MSENEDEYGKSAQKAMSVDGRADEACYGGCYEWGARSESFRSSTRCPEDHRIAGRVQHGTKPGSVAYLDAKEEDLVNLNVQEWKKQGSKQMKLQRQEAQRKKQEDRAAKQAEWQKAIEEEESEEAKSEERWR